MSQKQQTQFYFPIIKTINGKNLSKNPCGVAINPLNGDICFSDYHTHKIFKIQFNDDDSEQSEPSITTVIGNGMAGILGNGGLATTAQVNGPTELAFHPQNGDLYFCDYLNHSIRKISSTTGKVSIVAGTGAYGNSVDGGLAIFSQLQGPRGITFYGNEIYFTESMGQRIRKISFVTGAIETIAGNGTKGYSGDGGLAINAEFNNPSGIVIDSVHEDLYVCDAGNERIRRISLQTGIVSTVAGNGIQGCGKDGELAINSPLNGPWTIAMYRGEIYFCEIRNHRVRKISSSGILTTVAGCGTSGFSGDDGLAVSAKLNSPCGIAIDNYSGHIYITDYSNGRVRCIEEVSKELDKRNLKLKKYDRDSVSGTNLTCCKPVISSIAPKFYESIICNRELLTHLNSTQEEIVQYTIDYLIYDGNEDTTFDLIDLLFVLGLSSERHFKEYKKKLVEKFMNSISDESCSRILEKVTNLKEALPPFIKNELIHQMFDYAIEKVADLMKLFPLIPTYPIVQKHILLIASKLTVKPSCIIIKEDDPTPFDNQMKSIENLYNSKSTSDIIIMLGSKEIHCHKTILSSVSTYFEVLFNTGLEFQDFKDNIYHVDTEEFNENLHEIILQYCYGMIDSYSIDPSIIIPLFKCASFYQVECLLEYCVRNIEVTVDNFVNIVEQLGDYHIESLQEKFIQFGALYFTKIFCSSQTLSQLPSELKDKICVRYINNNFTDNEQ